MIDMSMEKEQSEPVPVDLSDVIKALNRWLHGSYAFSENCILNMPTFKIGAQIEAAIKILENYNKSK